MTNTTCKPWTIEHRTHEIHIGSHIVPKEYWVAVDRATGSSFGYRYATEEEAREATGKMSF